MSFPHSTRKTRAERYPARRALKSECVSWNAHFFSMAEESSYEGFRLGGCFFGPNPKLTESGYLLRGVTLGLMAEVNTGGDYYPRQMAEHTMANASMLFVSDFVVSSFLYIDLLDFQPICVFLAFYTKNKSREVSSETRLEK